MTDEERIFYDVRGHRMERLPSPDGEPGTIQLFCPVCPAPDNFVVLRPPKPE